MKRIWYELVGKDEFIDEGGTVDHPCYGLFPARDTAEEVADYFMTVGTDVEVVAVEADWTRAVEQ